MIGIREASWTVSTRAIGTVRSTQADSIHGQKRLLAKGDEDVLGPKGIVVCITSLHFEKCHAPSPGPMLHLGDFLRAILRY